MSDAEEEITSETQLLDDVSKAHVDTESGGGESHEQQETDESDTDEESAHDLLTALVQSEEEKLMKAANSKRSRSKRLTSKDDTEGSTVINFDSAGEELYHSKLSLNLQEAYLSGVSPLTQIEPSPKGPLSAAVLERNRRAYKLLKKHSSQTSKLVCGVLCILVIGAIGAGLLFLGFLYSIQDLYILGGIFAAGGIVFAIGFVVVRCSAHDELADYSVLYRNPADHT